MADSRFALSKQNIVEQLKENAKKQKHVENYTDLVECLANMSDWSVFYVVRNAYKVARLINFVENIIN